MGSEDWRIAPDDAATYFGHQKKRVELEQRRPVIRKASDLVGPGIASAAVSITDYNDPLATFNGYYSSVAGAAYAPNSGDSFIGSVVMDSTLGGVQQFTSLVSGNQYTRVFLRNPSDPDSITFGVWTSPEPVPAVVYQPGVDFDSRVYTDVQEDVETPLDLPILAFHGDPDTYVAGANMLHITRPGVYTGHLWIRVAEAIVLDWVKIDFPNGDVQSYDFIFNFDGDEGRLLPMNFITTLTDGFIRVTMKQGATPTATGEFNRLHLTRIGDA